MATCPVCGYEFEPASAENVRCPACGAPLAGEKTPDAEDAPAAEAAPAAPEGAEPASDDSAEGPVVSADAAPEAPSPGPAAAGAPGTEVHPVIADPYRPSPLARAWEDFKASPGKLWIILKLALFQFVPGVGSLVLNGYVYTWAREQALGRHLPLPHKIVRPGVLDNGLYIYGVSVIMSVCLIVLGLFSATVFGALGLPLIYVLLVIAFVVCCAPFMAVVNMRTALCGRVRSGINLKRAWSLFAAPGKTGQVFAATWAPLAIVMLCSAVLYVLLALVVLGSSISVAYGMGTAYHSDWYIFAQLVALFVSCIPLLLVVAFAIFFVGTVASMVTARALGYWVQDFRPDEWPEYRENVKYYMDRAV